MSVRLKHSLSEWKAVLCHIRRNETTWRGSPLSRQDHDTYTEAILLWTLVLCDLSDRYKGLGSHRDHVNFAHNVSKIDVDSLAAFLSAAVNLLRSASSPTVAYRLADYDSFKQSLSIDYPFAGLVIGPIKQAVSSYLSCQTPSTFYPVYQFLSFMTHLSLQDLEMGPELEDEYINKEKELAALRLPDDFVADCNKIMVEWLHDLKIESDDFIPKHGPGGVAELRGDTSLISKYRCLAPDQIIRYVFNKHMSLDVSELCPVECDVTTSRTSRIVFVPKSMKTKRVISAEPATLMYLQKGIDRILRKYVRGHHYLSRRIDFHDQSIQKQEALWASRTKRAATVDLSAASDSISWDLVKRVFANTALLPYLVALRSRSAELPSGKVVELTKYAPMGSALTFPIETLLFACICERTLRYVHSVKGVYNFRYRVFGDDIIVPNICLDELVSNLGRCGFRINSSKSYANNYRFRESCGCDAYDGVDVTPMKIGRSYCARRVTSFTPGVFAALCDMANTAYVYEFSMFRRFIIDKLVNDGDWIPLFSEDPDFGVYSPVPDNYRLPRRKNGKYQCTEVRASSPATYSSISSPAIRRNSSKRGFVDVGLPSHYDDLIRYFEWLRSTVNRDSSTSHIPEIVVKVTIGSTGSYLAKRWVSDPSQVLDPL